MKLVDSKITETKAQLKDLEREKETLISLFVKEKEKTKLDPDLEHTIFSQISSLKHLSKCGPSLDRIPCSLITDSPARTPKSRTIVEEHETPSGANESRWSVHHAQSKSMTFTEKAFDLRVDTKVCIKNHNSLTSPDFYKNLSFGKHIGRTDLDDGSSSKDIQTPCLGQEIPNTSENDSSGLRLNKEDPSPKPKEPGLNSLDFCQVEDNPDRDDINRNRLYKILSPNNHFRK